MPTDWQKAMVGYIKNTFLVLFTLASSVDTLTWMAMTDNITDATVVLTVDLLAKCIYTYHTLKNKLKCKRQAMEVFLTRIDLYCNIQVCNMQHKSTVLLSTNKYWLQCRTCM